jgi:ADP-heptose:LPS heptosyltransferase
MVNLCGKTTLIELLNVLKRFSLLISIDTGTVHMAALVRCPVVCIYTASNPLQWAPLMDKELMRLFCYNLVLKRYAIKDDRGIFESRPYVSPDDVVASSLELLLSRKP